MIMVRPQEQYYRHVAAPGTSSANSPSANPGEDWTKISDLAERRRIQNRIAQRNYRKKLKRRLEDLERRAGSSSASPPPRPEAQNNPQTVNVPSFTQLPDTRQQHKVLPSQYTPPTHPDGLMFPTNELNRNTSRTPPLFASYHGYPDDSYSSYHQPYRPGERLYPGGYVPAPNTLPPLVHFNESNKREEGPFDSYNAYNVYPGLPALDLQASHGYDDNSNPHTPAFSHSYEHSTNSSESGYYIPTTPPYSPPHTGERG